MIVRFLRSHHLFILMFSITLLLNISFTILRSVRNTLAVVDLGSGAGTIPFYELFGALPGSILMTWFLSRLMNRMSIQKMFFIAISLFLGFFLAFAFGLYPLLVKLRQQGEISNVLLQICSMTFYVAGELWKPVLIVILFWGLVNQHLPLNEAKKLYAPLMLGGSIGAICSGPLISFCTSKTTWDFFNISTEHWTFALSMLMLLITLFGITTAILYHRLWLFFSKQTPSLSLSQKFSIREGFSLCMRDSKLRLLAWIVMTDYIAYCLGEVIFLDVLKTKFPKACDYCNYIGFISSWAGALTIVTALFIAPMVFKHRGWVVAALITPICLLVTESTFFMFLRAKSISNLWLGWSEVEWVNIIVILGSLQYCICRTAKYTFFDSSKELAYVLMPTVQKMQGKLVIDGMCARFGRGTASSLSICLISLCGGVLASSLITGFIALGMGLSWLFTTMKLGEKFSKDEAQNIS